MRPYFISLLFSYSLVLGISSDEVFTCEFGSNIECPTKMCFYSIDNNKSCSRTGCATGTMCSEQKDAECFKSNDVYTCCCKEIGCASKYTGINNCEDHYEGNTTSVLTLNGNSIPETLKKQEERNTTLKTESTTTLNEEVRYSSTVDISDNQEEKTNSSIAQKTTTVMASAEYALTTNEVTIAKLKGLTSNIPKLSHDFDENVTSTTVLPTTPIVTEVKLTTTSLPEVIQTQPITQDSPDPVALTGLVLTTAKAITVITPIMLVKLNITTTPIYSITTDKGTEDMIVQEDISKSRNELTEAEQLVYSDVTTDASIFQTKDMKLEHIAHDKKNELSSLKTNTRKNSYISEKSVASFIPQQSEEKKKSHKFFFESKFDEGDGEKRDDSEKYEESSTVLTANEVTTLAVKNKELDSVWSAPIPWWSAVTLGFMISILLAWAVVIFLRKKKQRDVAKLNRRSQERGSVLVDPLLKTVEVNEQ